MQEVTTATFNAARGNANVRGLTANAGAGMENQSARVKFTAKFTTARLSASTGTAAEKRPVSTVAVTVRKLEYAGSAKATRISASPL